MRGLRFHSCSIYRLLAAFLGALFVAANAPAGAAKPGAATYAACMAKATSTRDMQVCQRAGLAEADARMKVALTKALAALPADQQAKLRASQLRWTAFRTSDCQVFYGESTGTMATVAGGDCMIDRALTRIKELATFSMK